MILMKDILIPNLYVFHTRNEEEMLRLKRFLDSVGWVSSSGNTFHGSWCKKASSGEYGLNLGIGKRGSLSHYLNNNYNIITFDDIIDVVEVDW